MPTWNVRAAGGGLLAGAGADRAGLTAGQCDRHGHPGSSGRGEQALLVGGHGRPRDLGQDPGEPLGFPPDGEGRDGGGPVVALHEQRPEDHG